MSNLVKNNKEYETAEKEKTLFENLSDNSTFNTLAQFATIGGFMVTLIVNIIAPVLFVFFNTPAHYYIFLAVISLIVTTIYSLSGLLLYLVSVRPKLKTLQAKTFKSNKDILSILTEDDELEKAVKHLESNYQTEIKTIEENHKMELESLQEDLHELSFLREPLKKQEQKISNFVDIEGDIELHKYEFKGDSNLKIVFSIKIFNKSFFKITFENNVGGELSFNNEPYLDQKRFFEKPPIIHPLQSEHILIEQRLSDNEVGKLQRAIKQYKEAKFPREAEELLSPYVPKIAFFNLEVTVKATNEYPNVYPQKLKTNFKYFDVRKLYDEIMKNEKEKMQTKK